MIYYIVPLVPIIIAIFVLAFALFGEISSNIEIIANVLVVISIIIFIGILIYALTRKTSTGRRTFSSIVTIVLGSIATCIIKWFVGGVLAEIEFSILGLIEFVFTVMVGGGICLFLVIGCIYLSLASTGEW